MPIHNVSALVPWTAADLVAAYDREIDHVLTIDFETYYGGDYTLSKMTNEAYVRDPRFEVIGVGVKIGGGQSVWMDEAGFRTWAASVPWDRVAVIAHHAHFDGLILAVHFGISPAFWFCTLSMARALHGVGGNSLERLAIRYGVGEKGHEVTNAQGKRLHDFTPEEYEAYGRYCRNDCDLEYGLWQVMRERFPAVELLCIDTTVRKYTEASFEVDQPLLTSALADERKRKADLLARVGREKAVFTSNDKFAALLVEFGEDPPTKPSPADPRKEIFAFAKSDPGMQELLDHKRDEVRWLAEARVGVKSTIAETRTERLLAIAKRGPVPIYLNYYGAHTGRWSGGDKMNPQNFQRGSPIRASLLAPDGEELVVVDSSQIEARGVGWLAGHAALLDVFRTASDFYSELGSQFLGRTITKKTDPEDRQLAKSMILGLGYGMGWAKFALELLKGMMGAKPRQFVQADADRYGVSIDRFRSDGRNRAKLATMLSRLDPEALAIHCAVTQYFVNRYRKQNEPIVSLWDEMSDVITVMAPDEGDPEEVRATFGPGGIFKVVRHAVVLPNGMELHYNGLHESEDDPGSYSYLGGFSGKQHKKIYGGLLTENVTQAFARIIVAEQMLWIRHFFEREYGPGAAVGFTRRSRIGLMTHDEVVARAPAEASDAALELALKVMRIGPAWAAGLPLGAEGGVDRSYGEAK